jgi:hypothetical protein
MTRISPIRLAIAAVFLLARVPAQAAGVMLQVRMHGAPAALRAIDVTAERTDGLTAPVRKSVVLDATEGVRLVDVAEAGEVWRVRAGGAGMWAAEKVVTIGIVDATVVLDVYPASALTGDVVMTQDDRAPTILSVAFRSVAASGEVDCSIVAKRWRCTLPAGLWDLRIKARGFIATHLWSVTLPPVGEASAGTIALRRGASVTGFVEVPSGVAPTAVVVTARPERSAVPYAGSERVERLSPSAKSNTRGFFQVDGMAPGDYRLTATAGNLISEARPVRVIDGAEAELVRPLRLIRPERVLLFVDPAVAPDGQQWHLLLRRSDEPSPEPLEVTLPVGGAVNLPLVLPGSYRLSIGTSAAHWYDDIIEVAAHSLPIQIHLPIVAIRGTVRMGDKPVAATITFGGEHGTVRIPLHSDDTGAFHGFLPRQGEWNVDMSAEAPAVHSTRVVVMVQRRDGAEEATVDLAVPLATMSGIVQLSGKGVEGAIVTLNAGGSVSQTDSGRDGTFRFDGVTPGESDVRAAFHGGYQAKAVVRTVHDGDDLRDIVLDLEAAEEIEGVVISRGGPVAGAVVYAFNLSDANPQISPVACSPDGRFSKRLSPGAVKATLYVTASGFAFRAMRAPVNGEPVTVAVQQDGGRLVLDFSAPFKVAPVIFENDVPVAFGILSMWSQVNGGVVTAQHVTLQNLEPGRYTVCIPTQAVSWQALWSGRRAPSCVSGTLAASSELRLSIPVENPTPSDTRTN